MSSKLFNPLENPPNPSSSDEEYEEEAEEIIGNSSSEEEEEEEEEEETDSEPETERKEPVKNPVPSVAKKNQDSKKRASETDASSDAVSGEENSSSEEEETDSEPETETKEPVKNPVPSVVKKNQDSKKVESSANKKRANETNASKDAKRVQTVSEEASSEEVEEETDSEPETETKEPVKNHGPSVAKKNQESKKVESSATTKKRASEADASTTKDAKRVKTVSGEETKKNYFQRVWSEEDEIAVLQGIIDYNIETGASPYDDTSLFYELVKKSISFDVSKTQFMEKLRSLKKKFENNLGKGKKKNGEDPAFSKPHDRKAFDLSKLVWGDNGIMALDSSAAKSNGKSRKSKKEELFSSSSPKLESMKEQEFVSIVESVARFGVDGLAAQQGWNRLASEDKKRFEEQWKALQIKEFKFFSQKSGFIHQVLTKMAEAFRPNP